MFYSLQEAAEKLNKTEEEVKHMVKQGKLREFRDGPNVMFKIDEVEALMSDSSIMASKETHTTSEQKEDEDEISLAPESTQAPAVEDELTNADTVMADTVMADADTDTASEEAIGALGETDSEPQTAEDMMGETKAASPEASLEEIEEDVNLDAFDSGSGLLDLSLQADDTSLGGILDEIYTSTEDEQGQQTTVAGSVTDVAAETEQIIPEEEFAAPQPALEAAIVPQAPIEPDTLSNAFGIVLFLPLLVIVYTAIVTLAGFNDVMPVILEKIQSLIWYIMLAVAVAAILIIAIPFMLSSKAPKTAKKQKAKRKDKKADKLPEPESETA